MGGVGEIPDMLKRLKYLIAEGFVVVSVSAFEARDPAVRGMARLSYRAWDSEGGWKTVSETYEVTAAEAEECSVVFFNYLA
ncbi:MAG: hypothetical protein JW706_09830 [Opitutales bacterium]|nr:hypothetical protein [Opitutales bacterium]